MPEQSNGVAAISATVADATLPKHHDIVMPIFSGVIFGTIGAFIGRALGLKGDSKERNLAQRFLMWGMGGFFGFIAAYSAYKSQPVAAKIPVQTIQPVLQATDTAYTNVGNTIPITTPPAGKPLPPLPMVQASSAPYSGLLDLNAGQQFG